MCLITLIEYKGSLVSDMPWNRICSICNITTYVYNGSGLVFYGSNHVRFDKKKELSQMSFSIHSVTFEKNTAFRITYSLFYYICNQIFALGISAITGIIFWK